MCVQQCLCSQAPHLKSQSDAHLLLVKEQQKKKNWGNIVIEARVVWLEEWHVYARLICHSGTLDSPQILFGELWIKKRYKVQKCLFESCSRADLVTFVQIQPFTPLVGLGAKLTSCLVVSLHVWVRTHRLELARFNESHKDGDRHFDWSFETTVRASEGTICTNRLIATAQPGRLG